MTHFTDSGINEKYYKWKELIMHTLLTPIINIRDGKHSFNVFSSRLNDELVDEYGKENVLRLDNNFSTMARDKTVFLLQLTFQEDIDLIMTDGFDKDAVFSVFKDDLIKADSTTLSRFKFLDPTVLFQEKFN